MSKVAFKNISFKYGQNQILKDFSLEIESGEILCLVGPSGCGKTTLVRCLLGLNKPDTGEIYVGDTCIFSAASTWRWSAGTSASFSRTTPCGPI